MVVPSPVYCCLAGAAPVIYSGVVQYNPVPLEERTCPALPVVVLAVNEPVIEISATVIDCPLANPPEAPAAQYVAVQLEVITCVLLEPVVSICCGSIF